MEQVFEGKRFLLYLHLLAGQLEDIVEEGHDLSIVIATFVVGEFDVTLEDEVVGVGFSLKGDYDLAEGGVGLLIFGNRVLDQQVVEEFFLDEVVHQPDLGSIEVVEANELQEMVDDVLRAIGLGLFLRQFLLLKQLEPRRKGSLQQFAQPLLNWEGQRVVEQLHVARDIDFYFLESFFHQVSFKFLIVLVSEGGDFVLEFEDALGQKLHPPCKGFFLAFFERRKLWEFPELTDI